MKRMTSFIFLVGSGFLLSGCVASERDMGALRQQLDELNTTITQMQSNQAELAVKMDELNRTLSVSNENFTQLGDNFSGLSRKLDDISVAVRQVAQVQETSTAQPAQVMSPSDLFNEAKNLLDKGVYDQAANGFKIYISKYPDTEQAEQAYIYLGDAYIALGQTKQAAVSYATLLQKYPKSKLLPTARLKYALSIVPLGKTDEAKRYLNSIVKEFASSPEAALAKAELAKLK